mmetsp:Transcript_6547/g.12369  ORF Transcript_6547/g.12369 Transcript_6547/m.12369 type:complete len:207 (+) Transcript_6547:65-685(+)
MSLLLGALAASEMVVAIGACGVSVWLMVEHKCTDAYITAGCALLYLFVSASLLWVACPTCAAKHSRGSRCCSFTVFSVSNWTVLLASGTLAVLLGCYLSDLESVVKKYDTPDLYFYNAIFSSEQHKHLPLYVAIAVASAHLLLFVWCTMLFMRLRQFDDDDRPFSTQYKKAFIDYKSAGHTGSGTPRTDAQRAYIEDKYKHYNLDR